MSQVISRDEFESSVGPLHREEEAHQNDFALVDFTTLNDYRKCAAYAHERHYRGLVPIGEGRSALRFGELIHIGLDILWRDQDLAQAVLSFTQLYDIEGDEKRSLERGCAILTEYWAVRRRLITSVTDIQSEHKFSHKFDSFAFGGRVDKTFRGMDGLISGLDHKTTTYNTAGGVSAQELSPQFVGYYQDILRSYPPEQVSRTFWLDLIVINPKNTEFILHPITITDRAIASWHAEQDMTYRRILESVTTGVWPKSAPWACTMYRGLCEYHPICQAPSEELAERFRETLYQIKPWEEVITE